MPVPPLPVPNAVTTVPAAMPGPTMEEPTFRAPEVNEFTVRVFPEMEPVRAAAEEGDTTKLELSTDCVVGAATVYVPAPPLPVPSAVTTVPGMIPGPVMGVPTAMVVPVATEDTDSVLPDMEATMAGATMGAVAATAVVVTVWGMLTVYVPEPPEPVPTAVITVPGAMLGPVIGEPTARVPDDTLLTVRVDPEIEPVKEAAGLPPTTVVVATV